MRKNEQYALMYEMAVFVEVVKQGSFTAAANVLGCSTSSVSRSVTKLENALATSLLTRTTRKATPEQQWGRGLQPLPTDGGSR